MRVDVLDLGSNTFHLLSADVVGHEVTAIVDAKIAVRLGERAFAEGEIPSDAFARGLDAIEALIARVDGRRPVVVATGVFREVTNATAFFDEVRRRCGVNVVMLTGREEARLTFRAVRAESHEPEARIAVFDLGGGSLECMLGEHGRLAFVSSLPLGALRLGTAHAGAAMPDRVREVVAATAHAIVTEIGARQPDEVVLSSGTARALLELARRCGHREHAFGCLSRPTVLELAQRLPALGASELAGLGVAAARHDTIAAGAVVFATLLDMLPVPFVRVASGALREGLALEVAETRTHALRTWPAQIAS